MGQFKEKEQENIVHENENYQVIATPNSTRGSYKVVNKNWSVGEGHFENLPSALSICEQMNNILVYSIWKKEADSVLDETIYTQPAEEDYFLTGEIEGNGNKKKEH